MSSVTINPVEKPLTYTRLLGKDITRLPDKTKVSRDIFVPTKAIQTPEAARKSALKKIVTFVTFAITGVYLAHRNNLFNPVKREAKKIIKNLDLQKRVKDFVDSKISTETYDDATRKMLQKLAGDKTRSKEFVAETQKLLTDDTAYKTLFKKVEQRLADDKIPERLRQGYAADVLDKLFIKIEKDLAKSKENSLPYKNQSDKIIANIFAKPEKGQSTVEEMLYGVINNRTASTIENHINKMVIETKLSR